MPTIYYLIPDLSKPKFNIKQLVKAVFKFTLLEYLETAFIRKEKPIGGIKVIYQHCILLKELGYSVYPVLMGKYKGDFFGFNLDYKTKKQVMQNLQKGDVVVATEFLPYQGLIFEAATKVLFMQNWINIKTRLNISDISRSYIDLGYDEVITCGEYCSQLVLKQMGVIAKTITNGIDLDKFQPNPQKRVINRVLALSRKNHDDLLEIMNLTSHVFYELIIVDDLTEEQLIEEYQKADIFLAMGYPEGFGLPPLEAMSCGCVVIGFTGGGASEFMINGITALVSDDGDCMSVAKNIELVLHDCNYKERLRSGGQEISKKYSLENTKFALLDFYSGCLNINPNSNIT